MASARPLHDILAGLAAPAGADDAVVSADPIAAVRDGGHTELPESLLAEAIVSYADTAPVEVAEHLAPFVTGHAPLPSEAEPPEVESGLELLASAPMPEPEATEDAPGSGPDAPPALAGFGAGVAPDPDGFDPAGFDPAGLDLTDSAPAGQSDLSFGQGGAPHQSGEGHDAEGTDHDAEGTDAWAAPGSEQPALGVEPSALDLEPEPDVDPVGEHPEPLRWDATDTAELDRNLTDPAESGLDDL